MYKHPLKWREFEFAFLVVLLLLLPLTVIAVHIVDISTLSSVAIETIDSLHAPGFGLVALFLLLALRRRMPLRKAYVVAFAGSITLGIFAELAQAIGPRDSSFSDLVHDAVGAAGFLGAIAIYDARKHLSLRIRAVAAIAVAALLVLSILPGLYFGGGLLARASAMPQLVDYDSLWLEPVLTPHSQNRLRIVERPEDWPAGPSHVVLANANPDNRLLYRLAPHTNWSQYTTLVFEASSATTKSYPVTLVIRDTFRRGPFWRNVFLQNLILGPDAQEFRIPLADIKSGPTDRELDLASIGNILLLADAPGGSESILVGQFRLE